MFKSSEIRWFSQDYDLLWESFVALPGKDMGISENVRTDYYLKSDTENTGIKIREGNHELKVKYAEDEIYEYGLITHWIKWSVAEEKNILTAIDKNLLKDWTPVTKKRFKKTYEVMSDTELNFVNENSAEEGIGVEFTQVHLETLNQPIFTVGLEAFSTSNKQRDNLMRGIKSLDMGLTSFKDLDSYGYPQLLKKFGSESK